MLHLATARGTFTAFLFTLVFPLMISAQSRGKCSPSYTTSDEFKEMTGERVYPKVAVDDVQIDSTKETPGFVIQEVIGQIKGREIAGHTDWLEEIQESTVRTVWQELGFFEVKSTAESQLLFGDADVKHYSVAIHVDEGPQFRLGDIGFRVSPDTFLLADSSGYVPNTPKVRKQLIQNDPSLASRSPAFPLEQLRQQVPMSKGDSFKPSKILEALDNLKTLYRTAGYFDFVATPLTDIDDSTQTISLIFELDQEQQYRVGKIEVTGMIPELQSRLTWPFKSGDIFDYSKFERFVAENKSIFPEGVTPDYFLIRRDPNQGTVSFRFNTRPCLPPVN